MKIGYIRSLNCLESWYHNIYPHDFTLKTEKPYGWLVCCLQVTIKLKNPLKTKWKFTIKNIPILVLLPTAELTRGTTLGSNLVGLLSCESLQRCMNIQFVSNSLQQLDCISLCVGTSL